MVHGDIRERNIMVTDKAGFKLIDFLGGNGRRGVISCIGTAFGRPPLREDSS